MKRSVVVIDGDKASLRLIANTLRNGGYEVSAASGGAEGYAMITSLCPDLVVLDPVLPDSDGLQLVRSIREWTQLPVLVVSAAAGGKNHIAALDAGADGCIDKPFSPAELLALVRAALRRLTEFESARGLALKTSYSCGGLFVDYDRRIVQVNGGDVHLTRNEFKILSLLCRYSGKVLTYEYLMQAVWGPHGSGGNGILRVNVTNIRRKIEPDTANPVYLFTENGVGYRMACEDG